ncbi:hypothetical protein PENTCL1PPCAC_3674, partial [Pristionchus entomophagus]
MYLVKDYQLFNDMVDGRCSLLSFRINNIDPRESLRLLKLLGITYIRNQFHSERRDVEVFLKGKRNWNGRFFFVIGSNMKISTSADFLPNTDHR